MRLFVNGENREIEPGTTIERLLEALGLAGRRVAVEVNRNVVRRSEWTATALEESDRVEIVQFVGGG